MNWLQKIKQAMPLPSVPSGYEGREDYGLHRMDNLLDNETVRWMEQSYPDIDYLGAGYHGVAFECSSGIVCKLTNLEEEAKLADQIRQQPISCTPEVYKVQMIQQEPTLWMIEMEKVELLNNLESSILGFWDVYTHSKSSSTVNIVPYRFMNAAESMDYAEKAAKFYKRNFQIDTQFDPSLVFKVLNAMTVCQNCLSENGIPMRDVSPSNLGWKGDQIVLFDLG